MQLLADLTRTTGAGALVVSHDERLRAVADRVLVLADGRLAGTGSLGAAPAVPMTSERHANEMAEHPVEGIGVASAWVATTS